MLPVDEGMLVLLRTNQVASLLSISANTVRVWADQEILPVHSRTVGGHRQFALKDVWAFWTSINQAGHSG